MTRGALTGVIRLASWAGLLLGLGLSASIMFWDLEVNCATLIRAYGLVCLALLGTITLGPVQLLGPTMVVGLYMTVSLFGLNLLVLVQPKSETLALFLASRHLYVDFLPQAFAISSLLLTSFVVGVYIGAKGSCKSSAVTKPVPRAVVSEFRASAFGRAYFIVSALAVYAYALFLVLLTIRTGLLHMNYSDVRDVLSVFGIRSYLQGFFWVALASTGAFFNKHYLWIVGPGVLIVGVVLLASGNRNDILYPLLAAFSMYVWANRRVPLLPTLFGGFVVFAVSPWIGTTRSGDFDADLVLDVGGSLAELGGQIRPFTQVLYLNDMGLDFYWGMTMFVPSIAVLTLGLFLRSSEFTTSGYSIGNLLTSQGHQGMAFSLPAELWLNFGLVGAAAAIFVIGYFLARAEKVTSTTSGVLLLATSTLLLVFWARNSMDMALIYFVYLGVLVVASKLLKDIPTVSRQVLS